MGSRDEPALPAGRIFNATVFCVFGPLVWSLHLGVVYAAHHVACRTGAPAESSIAAFVVGTTALAAAILAGAWLSPKRLAALLGCPADAPMAFFIAVMRWLALLSACGIVWAGAGALFVASCAPLA